MLKAKLPKINIDGIKFSSRKLADHYQLLKERQALGDIKYFLRQVALDLGNGEKHICDFMIVWADDSISFQQVKNYNSPLYLIKKQTVEANCPIKIKEV